MNASSEKNNHDFLKTPRSGGDKSQAIRIRDKNPRWIGAGCKMGLGDNRFGAQFLVRSSRRMKHVGSTHNITPKRGGEKVVVASDNKEESCQSEFEMMDPLAYLQFDRLRACGCLILSCVFSAVWAGPDRLSIHGLTPYEVVVLANSTYPHSEGLARYYMEIREIPEKHLLVMEMPRDEVISRREYEQYIAAPVKDFLVGGSLDHIRCIVLIYGTPLRVKEPLETMEQKRLQELCEDKLDEFRDLLVQIRLELNRLGGRDDLEPGEALPVFDMKENPGPQYEEIKDLLRKEIRSVYHSIADKPEADDLKREWMKVWTRLYGFLRPNTRDYSDLPDHPTYVNDRFATGTAHLMGRFDELIGSMNTAAGFESSLEELLPVIGIVRVMSLCLEIRRMAISDWESSASVDSELSALFWPPYRLKRRYPNPLNLERIKSGRSKKKPTLMVARIDGPDIETVRRMLGDCIETEKKGLAGTVCLDARGCEGEDSYAVYDQNIIQLARLIDDHTSMPITLDQRDKLFESGDCLGTALYCGWYSLAKYKDAFEFMPGSIGFHIASSEAKSLRGKGAEYWCPQLLMDGCAATLGPVAEPYLDAFPLPAQFFGLLMTGRLTLVDCYYLSLPNISWMMTLIGDPLYNPFRMNPLIPVEVVDAECFR